MITILNLKAWRGAGSTPSFIGLKALARPAAK